MRWTNILLLSLLLFPALSNAEFAPECVELVPNTKITSPEKYQTNLEKLNSEISDRPKLGRIYSFEEALALIGSYLPAQATPVFFKQVSELFYSKRILQKNIAHKKSHLKYRNRFISWGVQRSKSANIIWSNQRVQTQTELEQMLEAAIDIYTEAAFIPVRQHTIYMAQPTQFLGNNLSIMREKLLLKIMVLGERPQTSDSFFSNVVSKTKTILSFLLPVHFTSIRNLKVKQKHIDIVKQEGPQALYNYLKYREGLPLAIRYWMTHLTNVQALSFVAFAAVLAPNTLDTWNYFAERQAFSADSEEQYEQSLILYQAMKTPTEELRSLIETEIETLPADEQDVFLKALEDAYE